MKGMIRYERLNEICLYTVINMSEEGIKICAKMYSKDDVSMFISGLRKKWTRDSTNKSKLGNSLFFPII